MSEHTKTPWRADQPRTYAGVKWDCIIRGAENSPVCIVTVAGFPANESKANAAFIVKAVNNHDALVKALKESAADIVGSCKNPDDPYIAEALRRIGDVLADVGKV
jgi:hypothetical protein